MDNITSLFDQLTSSLPSVVVAVLVLILAFLCAWIAKVAVKKLMRLVRLDQLLAKAKIDKEHREETKNFIAKLVYLIVFALFLPGVFEKLGLTSIASPITSMVNIFMTYLPNIVAAFVLVLIGFFVARLVYGLLETALATTKLDQWVAKLVATTDTKLSSKFSLAKIIALTVRYVIVILFAVEALSTLQLESLTQIGNQIIGYLPLAISAVLILTATIIAGRYVEKLILDKFKNSGTIALIARIAITVVGVLVTLYQLGVAPAMINTAFILVLGAVSVAFAIAFGIGGRDFAARMLSRLEKRIGAPKK